MIGEDKGFHFAAQFAAIVSIHNPDTVLDILGIEIGYDHFL